MTDRRNREAKAAAVAAAAVLFLGRWGAAPAATSFTPSLGTVAAWTDNINLTPPGQEQPGMIWDVEPGLSITHDSLREHATLDYTLHALLFNGGHHYFLHSGSLASVTHVVPDWFELDIAGQRSQGAADPAVPANIEYLFPAINLANYTTGVVKPILKHAFRHVQVQASYTAGIADDGAVGGQNSFEYRSQERDADFTASSVDQNARVTWNTSYHREQDDYEFPYSLRFRYEQATGELGLLTTSTFRLIARGGEESDPTNGISQGGLQSPLWAAGFDWSTGPKNELRLLAGHRYFGRTYDALWRHDARLLHLQVNYSEMPTTQDAQMMLQPLAAPPIVTVPGTLGTTQLLPSVYLDKSLTGAATITGRLTKIGLSISSDRQTYYAIGGANLIVPRRRGLPLALGQLSGATPAIESAFREQSATLDATRQLGALMSFKVSATYGKVDLIEGTDSAYDTQEYTAVLTRQIGRRSSLYLQVDHIKQYGQIAVYKADVVSLGANFDFGNASAGSSGQSQGFGDSANNGP